MTKHHRSEPTCRICSCTEHNACDEGCSWVRVEKGSPPLCSACDGKPADLVEACGRAIRILNGAGLLRGRIVKATAILRAAKRRFAIRVASEILNPDQTWGR